MLLAAHAQVNALASRDSGRTALQAAAEGGHKEIVEVLLAANADVNARTSESRTPLQAAAEGGHREIVEVLFAAGADVNAPASRPSGRTALQAEMEGGHREVVELLLEGNADVTCSGGKTIFGLASSIELVKLLIHRGANPDLRNDSGETALHEAVWAGMVDWLQSLLDLEFFDMDARNPRRETALRIALQPGSPNTIYAPLLSKGASTEGLVVGMLPKKTPGEWTIVFQESATPGGMSVEWRKSGSGFELKYGGLRSIWLLQ